VAMLMLTVKKVTQKNFPLNGREPLVVGTKRFEFAVSI
jgi:hypothetical protein